MDSFEGGYRIIEHDFGADEIAYKYPVENFYSGSVVFVKPGQEVLFVLDEHIELIDREGRYTLDTNNVPPKFRFFVKSKNEVPIFHCYIYFINKQKALKCSWGTPDAIPVDSEKYKSTFGVVANGSYTLVINDSVEFFKTTLGQLPSYSVQDIDDFIFNEVIQTITTKISVALQHNGIVFSKLSSESLNLAREISAQLTEDEVFEHYGFKLKTGIAFHTLKLREADMKIVQAADERLREVELKKTERLTEGSVENQLFLDRGLAEAEIMKQKGAFYAQERSYDVLQAAASNEGGGGGLGGASLLNSGIGLGMGVGLGQGFGRAMGDVATNAFNPAAMTTPAQPEQIVVCPKCGANNNKESKFCNKCGNQIIELNICPNCNHENALDAAFCSKCGNKLLKEKICPSCGEVNGKDASFCGKCGSKL